ncbi:stalk domain-containing protein [Pelotomaculum sp. PtaB.Bin117]|uniref:stalk domain-containing protein n=1 Tax=Pelotomaculum sp. PtaB.Bin117 TaxID=1811694 RepID=UPI0009CFEA58|nr:stalk domain-containing protein [Pelotomaculum sp. PtaB.Bin117]OPX87086.1 MAG: hypothetical protein A4E54_01845 [Pelotomaculum sp. PtaB.Bin117]
MNKHLLSFLLIFCLTATASANASQINVSEINNGEAWCLQEGQSLNLSLDSNPSTGYSWQYQSKPDASLLEETGHFYQEIQVIEGPPVVGAGGKENWTYLAKNTGETSITLWYSRPWESVMPLKTYILEIIVVPKIQILLEQNLLDFDTPPVIADDLTLVPLRAIFEALGAKVDWVPAEQKVVATKDNQVMELIVGNNICYINGAAVKLEISPPIMGNRVLIPLKVVSDFFGCKVVQDEDVIKIYY